MSINYCLMSVILVCNGCQNELKWFQTYAAKICRLRWLKITTKKKYAQKRTSKGVEGIIGVIQEHIVIQTRKVCISEQLNPTKNQSFLASCLTQFWSWKYCPFGLLKLDMQQENFEMQKGRLLISLLSKAENRSSNINRMEQNMELFVQMGVLESINHINSL